MVANDPGRTNLCFMVERLPTGGVRKFVLKRTTYYEKSGINRAIDRNAAWARGARARGGEAAWAFRDTDLKTTNPGVWDEYLGGYQAHKGTVWDEMLKKKYAKERFRTWRGKRRTVDRFFQSVRKADKERDVVVGWGQARFPSSARGGRAAPTTKLFQIAQWHLRVMLVDEFRTTQVCHSCYQRLQPVREKEDADSPPREVRGLRRCDSIGLCDMQCSFLDRDLNAALNILTCFLCLLTGVNRPERMRRGTKRTPEKAPLVLVRVDSRRYRLEPPRRP